MMEFKKGEMSTQQIVMMIVLITSFLVLLFFLLRLNLQEETQKEICYNSVVSKGVEGFSKDLDCKTNYLCISGGENCKQIVPTQTAEVDNKEETLEVISKEMSDCWRIFGEGKVDYTGSTDYIGFHCAICSVVEFDEKIQKLEISYRDLFEFLEKNNQTSSQTYLNYLFAVSKANDFISKSNYLQRNYEANFDLTEKYSIITGINSEVVGPDYVIPVYFMRTKALNETNCDFFDITKA